MRCCAPVLAAFCLLFSGSTGLHAAERFVPPANCCAPAPAAVKRNTAPLASWVLSESPLGESETRADPRAPELLPPLPPATALAESGPAVAETYSVPPNLRAVLERWTIASRILEPMCPARVRRLTRELESDYLGHEIEWLALFQGPVTLDDIAAPLEWIAFRADDNGARLSAVPREPITRLFVGRIEVTLDGETSLPTRVRFFNRRGEPRTDDVALSALRTIPSSPPTIQTAAADDDTHAGATVIRTAEWKTHGQAAVGRVTPVNDARMILEAPTDIDWTAWAKAALRVYFHEFEAWTVPLRLLAPEEAPTVPDQFDRD